MSEVRIRIVLADDNALVREGAVSLLGAHPDLEVVRAVADLDTLLEAARRLEPDVIVTDIRMPPGFLREGLEAAHAIRAELPSTGVVVLSQYDDPDYALRLLHQGAAGCAYVLKDRLGVADQLALAIRRVSVGGTWLDPKVAAGLDARICGTREPEADESLFGEIERGRSVREIALARAVDEALVADEIDELFLRLARSAGSGERRALDKLKILHTSIVDGQQLHRSLSRLLPGGLIETLRRKGWEPGWSEAADVTVLMGDVRGYTTIAESLDPEVLASMLSAHWAAMTEEIHGAGGTIMDFAGDSVMAVFGSPEPMPDHPDRALGVARRMHSIQSRLNREWRERRLPSFHLGVGLSSGRVVAGLLGSQVRLEYALVGDSVNLAQRVQQFARGGEITMTESTYRMLRDPLEAEHLGEVPIRGRAGRVGIYRVRGASTGQDTSPGMAAIDPAP